MMSKTQSRDDISHAIVYSLESEDIHILPNSEINKFAPRHRADFEEKKSYFTVERGKVRDEFYILDLGNENEMNKALEIINTSDLSHAVVFYIDEKKVDVVPTSDIRQFSKYPPKYKHNYLETATYNVKKDSDNFNREAHIYGFGGCDEMTSLCIEMGSITHGLVYFILDEAFQTIKIQNIKEFEIIQPKNSRDFKPMKIYNGRRNSDEEYESVQILLFGNYVECSTKIDEFNKVTHAFVVFKKTNAQEVIPANMIQEFKNKLPEECNDFDKNKPYSGRLPGASKYSAVQIISLGHETILNYQKTNSLTRIKKINFNRSDINDCDKSVSSDVADSEENCTLTEDSDVENAVRKKKYIGNRRKFNERKAALLNENSGALNAKLQENNPSNDQINQFSNEKNSNKRATKKSSCQRRFAPPSSPDEEESVDRSLQRSQRKRKRFRKNLKPAATKKSRRPKNVPSDHEIFYDMELDDSSTGSTSEREMLERFNKDDEASGKKTELIHVGYGHTIIYEEWKKDIKKKSKDDQAFIKNFVRVIYGKSILEKCLQKKPYMLAIEGKTRSIIPSDVIEALKKCLKYWIITKCKHLLSERTMEQILANVKHVISEEINDQFKNYKISGGKVEYIRLNVHEQNG